MQKRKQINFQQLQHEIFPNQKQTSNISKIPSIILGGMESEQYTEYHELHKLLKVEIFLRREKFVPKTIKTVYSFLDENCMNNTQIPSNYRALIALTFGQVSTCKHILCGSGFDCLNNFCCMVYCKQKEFVLLFSNINIDEVIIDVFTMYAIKLDDNNNVENSITSTLTPIRFISGIQTCPKCVGLYVIKNKIDNVNIKNISSDWNKAIICYLNSIRPQIMANFAQDFSEKQLFVQIIDNNKLDMPSNLKDDSRALRLIYYNQK
eukprot:443140_1